MTQKTAKNGLFGLILDLSPAHESESEFGLASPSLTLESGHTFYLKHKSSSLSLTELGI